MDQFDKNVRISDMFPFTLSTTVVALRLNALMYFFLECMLHK